MKLKTKQLLDFIRLSSVITSNSILPIHKYLKLEANTLSKSNGRVFLRQTIEAPISEAVLIEENDFNAFVKFTKADEIDLTIKPVKGSEEKEVVLHDGFAKVKFQVPPVKDFDALPVFDGDDYVELDSEALQAIGIAKSCTTDIGGGANFDFVFLKDNFIFATDKNKLYSKKAVGIPDAFFDKDCATVISQFNSVKFCKKDKFNLFEAGNVLYGFQQFGEVKPPDIKPFIQKSLEGDYFEFEAADLIRFCELVTASIPVHNKEVTECDMNGGSLFCRKEEYGKEVDMTIPFTGNFEAKMKFNPKFLAPYIRSLGAPTIRFYEFPKIGFYVADPDDKDFLGMVSGLQY